MTIKIQPILSIIIPTKNRDQYLMPTLRSLLLWPDADIEIVVQDNSDNEKTSEAIAALPRDPRLFYQRCPGPLSVTDNFSLGLDVSHGKYVAFIGDDDGVNPELAEAVRWAASEELDALVGYPGCTYFWPDVVFNLYGKRLSGALYLKPFSGMVTYPDPEAEMSRCARMAGYSFGRLPKSYHGAVRRKFMEMVRQRTGIYFPGPTPDMASAMALASFIKRYAYIDYPLFIAGSGRGSGGGAGAEKKHNWSLESAPWFSRQAIANWSDVVPRYCSGTTLWAEDVIQAMRAVGRENVLKSFNGVFLYARCIAFNREYKTQIQVAFRRFRETRRIGKPRAAVAFVYYYLWTWEKRLAALVSNATLLAGLSRTKKIPGLADIFQAVDALSRSLRSKGRHFNERKY